MGPRQRASFVEAYSRLLASVWGDERIARRLEVDAGGVLAEFGFHAPAGAVCKVIREPDGAPDIAVLIDNYPAAGKPSNTKFFGCDYGASANGHYESIEMYLKTLIDASKNLDPNH